MLPTYQNTINHVVAFGDAFSVRDEPVSPRIAALERDLTGRSVHTTSEIGGDRVVLSVYPGLGRASVTLSVAEDLEYTRDTTHGTPVYEYTRTPVFRVIVAPYFATGSRRAMLRAPSEIPSCSPSSL